MQVLTASLYEEASIRLSEASGALDAFLMLLGSVKPDEFDIPACDLHALIAPAVLEVREAKKCLCGRDFPG